jgi:hypothetical protein
MTLPRLVLVAAGALALGCPPSDRDRGIPTSQQGTVLPGPDGPGSGRSSGPSTGSGGSGEGGSQLPGAGGGGASSCETLACAACSDCAVSGPCNDRVLACDASPLCRSALDCLASCYGTCAGDPTCLQQCGIPCNDGSGAVQQANGVFDCVCQGACAAACQSDEFNECESIIPFAG